MEIPPSKNQAFNTVAERKNKQMGRNISLKSLTNKSGFSALFSTGANRFK